jgi:hypothetical protein
MLAEFYGSYGTSPEPLEVIVKSTEKIDYENLVSQVSDVSTCGTGLRIS